MAKIIDLGDITMTKKGDRMALRLNAEEMSIKNYKGEVITLKKGDYINVDSYDECLDSFNYLLENDKISQDFYDNKVSYLQKIKDAFRARLTVRSK